MAGLNGVEIYSRGGGALDEASEGSFDQVWTGLVAAVEHVTSKANQSRAKQSKEARSDWLLVAVRVVLFFFFSFLLLIQR